MKNYAALVANFKVETCLCFEIVFAVSELCSKSGCDWHNFNMAMGQKRYKLVFTQLYLLRTFSRKPLNFGHYFMCIVCILFIFSIQKIILHVHLKVTMHMYSKSDNAHVFIVLKDTFTFPHKLTVKLSRNNCIMRVLSL